MRFYRNMAERAATNYQLHQREVMVRLNRIQENVNILLDIMKRDDELVNELDREQRDVYQQHFGSS